MGHTYSCENKQGFSFATENLHMKFVITILRCHLLGESVCHRHSSKGQNKNIPVKLSKISEP